LLVKNNKYTIEEINNGVYGLSSYLNHLKSVKDIICNNSKNQSDEYIPGGFITEQIGRLRNESDYFAFLAYQEVTLYKNDTIRPTAVLFARKGSKNNTYILTLLCRFWQAQKGLGKILLDKLIQKAINENIDYIYLESVPGAIDFYHKNDFSDDDEKNVHTDSAIKPELAGQILVVKNYRIAQDPQNGGSYGSSKYHFNDILKTHNQTLSSSQEYSNVKDNLNFKISSQGSIHNISLFNDSAQVGKLFMKDSMSMLLGYVSMRICEINASTDDYLGILLIIADNICKNNYIQQTTFITNDNNIILMLKKMGYEQDFSYKDRTDPHKFKFQKIHHKNHVIDRTVLKY
jgi:hypothetical protein